MRALILLLALLALLLPDPAAAQIRLPSIKNKLIELALDQISSPGSFEVTAGAIEDLEGGITSLVDVQVSDNDGVWLTLERLNFGWRPDALLSGELAITRLELVGLTVSRPPSQDAEPPQLKPQEPSGRGLFDWPRAPIALSVDGVKLERVSIAEGVLPQAIAFDAEGRAFDKGDLQELALTLSRTDAVAGSIDLSMQRNFAANTVKLTLTANEAAGGLVAAAAGLPGDAPARLVLNADGPPEDWRLIFDAAVERVFAAQGRATLAYAERLSVDADLTVTPAPELGQELRTVLGERARLTARLTEREDGLIEIQAGELSSPALKLSASGAFATGPGESDLSVSLEALSPLADLAEGVGFDRFSFDGRVFGPQGGLTAEGSMALTALATAPLDAARLALDGRVAQGQAGWSFDLDGRGEGLRIDRLGPEILGPAALSAAGTLEGDLLTLTRAALESRALAATASGRYDLAAKAGDLSAGLTTPEIAPLAGAYGAAASGAVSASAEVTLAGDRMDADLSAALERFVFDRIAADRLTLTGHVAQDAGRIDFDLTGGGEGLALDQVPQDLTRELQLVAKGRMEGGTLALETLHLASPLVTADASGSVVLEAGTLGLDYAVSTTDLAPVALAYGADAAGAVEAAGHAEGAFAALHLTGQASVAEASYGGRAYGAVELSHDVTLGEAPEGSLSLAVSGGALGEARAETRFRLAAPKLTLEGLVARLLDTDIAGGATIDLDATLVDGTFDLSADDLAALGSFAGLELGGSARGQVTLSPRSGRQDVMADLTVTGLNTDGASVAQAGLRLAAEDVLGTPRVDARLEADGIEAGQVSLTTLRAEAAGPLGKLAFSAEADGTLGAEPLKAIAAGEADASGAVTDLTLARAEVTVGPDRLALRQPARLRIAGGSITASGLDLALPGEAALTGDVGLHPGGFAGELVLSRLPMELMQRRAGAPFSEGLVDARAMFDTRPGRAGAEFTARARGLQFSRAQADAGEFDLDLDAGWNGARLDARAELRGSFGEPMRARVGLPLRPGAGGVPVVPSDGALDGAVTWAGNIGDLWALVPAPGHILDGRADIDLRLGGTVAAPRLAGRADLTGGEYQNLITGTILTNLTLTTSVTEDGTVNVALDADDGAKGTVSARAALRLGAAKPTIDGRATVEGATLVRRDDVTARLSADLTLAGPLSDLLLAGRITIKKAEVRLIGATPPDLVDLEGIRIKGAPEPAPKGDGDSRVTLDLTVVAERDIFIRGRGLDSEWKMDLAITGDAVQPVIIGRVERVRGQLDLLGRPFELARGQVIFDGGREIDPLLDVAVEYEDNDIRGGIALSGRGSAPELHFYSTPALPEDEVLPRLLFGRSKQALSGPEALQLVTGMATLMSGKAGPLDFFRKAAGVDVLRVEGQTPEEATVTVGRNVAKGVFVGARQGLGEQGSSMAVEVEVFDGVVVDTEFGQETGADIGITIRKDF